MMDDSAPAPLPTASFNRSFRGRRPLSMDASERDVEEPDYASAKLLKEFISTYKSLPVLWDNKHPQYSNRFQRQKALDALLVVYRKQKPSATTYDVKRKINTLRCNYKRDVNKIKKTLESGCSADQVYKPTSWVFYAMKFLHKLEFPSGIEISNDSEFLDDSAGASSELGDESVETITLSVWEPSTSPAQSSSPAGSPAYLPPPRKLPKMSKSSLPRQQELLHVPCSFQTEAADDGKVNPEVIVWSKKLTSLEPMQRLYAEKAINDVLFEAQLGNLHRDSVEINERHRDQCPVYPEYKYSPDTAASLNPLSPRSPDTAAG